MYKIGPVRCASSATGSLVPHAILAGENALDDSDHCLMPLGCLAQSSLVVLRGNVGKQTARVLFADDFELCQGNEERLANAEAAMPSASLKRGCFAMRCPFDR